MRRILMMFALIVLALMGIVKDISYGWDLQ